MKKILASLLTAYVLTNGQAPPVEVVQTAQTTSAPAVQSAQTTAAAASGQTTTAAQSAGTSPPGTTPRAAQTTAAAPVTTAAASVQTTGAATTSAPVAPVTTAAAQATTSAPVQTTAAPAPRITPAPTLNPYCPLDAGVQSGIQPNQFDENRVCFMPNEIATDYLGRLRCNNFACCQCAQINCGFNGYPCEQLQIGDSGAVGVKSINIRGAPEMNNNPLQNIFGGNAFGHHGAKMECQGRESCMAATIRGEMIAEAQCSGDMGCQDANIVINDPIPQMNVQCNGLMSCQRANIEINVGVAEAATRAAGQGCNPAYAGVVNELGKIEFNGQFAGSQATVTIRNKGCGTLLIDNFECMSLESCPGLGVNIEGNVAIRNCDLMGVAPGNPRIRTLVAACTAGQNYNNWNTGNTMPILPGQPTFPIQPQPPQQQVPVIPPNPVNPNPTNPVNPTPVIPNPAPVNPFPGQFVGLVDPRSASMQCDQVGMPMLGVGISNPRACAGTTQTVQIADNFVLDCSQAGACNRMTLTLNAGYDPTNPGFPTTRIDALKFIQPTSDVTIYINNEFGAMGQPVRINDVRCEGPNTCRNLKIIAGPGVDILSTNFDCQDMMSCIGATVQQGTMTMPMDPRTQGMPYAGGYQPQQPMPFNPWV